MCMWKCVVLFYYRIVILHFFVWQFHFLSLPLNCTLYKEYASGSTCSSFSPQPLVKMGSK